MSVTSGGTAPNGCSAGGRSVRVGRLGRDGDDLVDRPLVAVAVPAPDRRRTGPRSRPRRRRTPTSPRGRGTGAAPAPSGAAAPRSTRLQVPARRRGPRSAARGRTCWPSSSSGTMPSSIIDGVPHSLVISDVLVEVPPGVVGQVLRAAVGLPGAQHVEGGVVEQRDPARPVVAVARRRGRSGRPRPGRSAGCAGASSRPSRPAPSRSIVLSSRGRARVGLGVVDVDVASCAGPGSSR